MRTLPLLVLLAAPFHAQSGLAPCTRILRVFEGEVAGDQFGWVSAPVPDVNGDGFEELLVGAPGHDGGGSNSGRAYLFDVAAGVELLHLDGSRAGQRLGHATRPAGDVDGDGVEDLALGGVGSATVAGVVRLFSGASGALIREVKLGATADAFGHVLESLGDVNADGVPDLAVGAPNNDAAGADAGRVYVVSGADGTTLHSFVGPSIGAHFGSAVARLGDVNGDGLPELIVGAADAGAGSRGRVFVYDLAQDALLYPALVPDSSANEFGQFFIAELGRVNDDVFPDFYVGDFADGANQRGKAYVFDGVSGARIQTLTGNGGDGFGIGRGLGDMNDDGRADLVLGSWTANSGANRAGELEVFSARDGVRLRTVTSVTAGEELGFDAHGLGDLDGDGRSELVGTAASFASSRGRALVIADRVEEPLGAGLSGTGGFVPTLEFTGCPELGGSVSLDVSAALGAAPATLFLGSDRRDRLVRGGLLHPTAIFHRQMVVSSGTPGVGGSGAFSLPFVLPLDPALIGMSFFTQAVVQDPGATLGVAFTPGLRLTLY